MDRRNQKGNGMKAKGYYLQYRSRFTGKRCIAVVTLASNNVKTGPMAQVWFLSEDENPVEVRQCGTESTICGSCPLQGGNGCYVRVEQAPLSVWRAYHNGRYDNLWQANRADVRPHTRRVRFGAYGDPASMPRELWEWLTGFLAPERWTGYTHSWHMSPWLKRWCMASTTAYDNTEALAAGWSTFAALPDQSAVDRLHGRDAFPTGARYGACPYLKGVTCENCCRCNGRQPGRRQQTIMVAVHGARAGKVYA